MKVRFGLNIDMLVSNLTTTYNAPYLPHMVVPPSEFSCKPYVGMGFGVKVKIDLWKGLGIDTGVGYSFYGADTDWGGMIYKGDYGRMYETKIKFENFYFPVLVYYQFNIPGVSNIFIPSVCTGPVVEFSAGPRMVFGKTNTNTLVHWKFGINLLFKEHIKLSAGYNLPLNNAFSFEVIIDNSSKYKRIYSKVNYWSIGVGYFF